MTKMMDFQTQVRVENSERVYKESQYVSLIILGAIAAYEALTIRAPEIRGLGPVLTGFLSAGFVYRIGQINKRFADSTRASFRKTSLESLA